MNKNLLSNYINDNNVYEIHSTLAVNDNTFIYEKYENKKPIHPYKAEHLRRDYKQLATKNLRIVFSNATYSNAVKLV